VIATLTEIIGKFGEGDSFLSFSHDFLTIFVSAPSSVILFISGVGGSQSHYLWQSGVI